jgi:hypothetical protein
MIGPLFTISSKGEFERTDDRVLLVPEFAKLLKLKEGERLFQFVYCCCDYYSPYVRVMEMAEREKLVAMDLFKGSRSPQLEEPVIEAMQKYRILQEHPLMEQYAVMQETWKSMSDEVKNLTGDIGKRMRVSEQLQKYVIAMEAHEKVIADKNAKIGGLSNMSKSLSIIERRLRASQIK